MILPRELRSTARYSNTFIGSWIRGSGAYSCIITLDWEKGWTQDQQKYQEEELPKAAKAAKRPGRTLMNHTWRDATVQRYSRSAA